MNKGPIVKIWRLHPKGAAVVPADSTLGGDAPLSARKHCGPYMHANGAGFYLHSPFDIDLSFDLDREFPWHWTIHGEGYKDDEIEILKSMRVNHPQFRAEMITRRPKLFLSSLSDEPTQTAQIWTGCIFQTAPGWALWIRGPINREHGTPFRIEEAIIESDWLHYDIWLNLRFFRFGEVAKIRRDGPPLAQVVPVPLESYSSVQLEDKQLSPKDPEAQAIFDRWVKYTWEKFYACGDRIKDPTTYHRWRTKLCRTNSTSSER